MGTVTAAIVGSGNIYLPPWAGNLDIMTAAAARVGEMLTPRGIWAWRRAGYVGGQEDMIIDVALQLQEEAARG
jgi:DmpG-like communication domain